jgi:hypothetical protein
MYVRGSEPTLVAVGENPHLESTERFWTVLETLPDDQIIPARIVKLGFLTDQLQINESGYKIRFSVEGIKEQTTAHVPPRTLAAIPKLLYDLVDDLPEKRKRATGVFCDATDLDRPPQDGTPPDVLRDVAPDTYDGCLDFIKEVTGESTTTRSSTEESQAARGASAESTSQPSSPSSPDASSAGQSERTHSKTRAQGTGTDSAPTKTSSSGSASKTEAITTARETSEDDPFASGKEITTKGGERITGKNPFADPDRVKDTGLHQGGG